MVSSSNPADTSTKPYLIRAIHEWCTDNGYTPYLAVSIDSRCVVPRDFVKAGEIVLNVSSTATNALSLGNDLIEFQARFGGVAREISVPVECVSAVYARENGHGMAFDVPKPLAITPDDAVVQAIKPVPSKPVLKAVPDLSNAPQQDQPLASVASSEPDEPPTPPSSPSTPSNPPQSGSTGGPPKLKRIK
jgi:stringent starvation protein B